MRIAVTVRFQNSYFSGSIPQVATALSRALAGAGHAVTLLIPRGEPDWFIDVPEYKACLPAIRAWDGEERFDVAIEVVWAFKPAERVAVAPRVIGLVHYPPVFHDMESSVYMWNPAIRDFSNLAELWTWDFYSKTDVQYLEFLSGLQVTKIPFVWDPDALELFVRKEGIPEWKDSAHIVEGMLPPGAPSSMSWCARIMESNFSNTSHCVLPLNIVSEIRKRVCPIRFTVHNGENVGKHPFFLTNIAKNLLLPDLSGNMVPRVRLPELRKEKTFFITHQRFRPLKTFMLDALYLGIPMLHNCAILRSLGAPYYYELNQIVQATEAFKTMEADYKSQSNFFSPAALDARRAVLRMKFGPPACVRPFQEALNRAPRNRVAPAVAPVVAPAVVPKPPSLVVSNGKVLRVAFAHMWDDFQPTHNFFLTLLDWAGSKNGVKAVLDETAPDVVFFGPFSAGSEKRWPTTPKVYFTGENSAPNNDPTTFLNIGFQYNTDPNYVRLPLWVLEVNWWGMDVEKLVNPKPVSVRDATTASPWGERKKFCAFVASNPANANRNAAFHILDRWRGVESGGRLFTNRAGGPIPAGRGGGGGELAKVDYYKDFQFVITYENSSSPGYTTEKLFHAKVAGAIPIYWGDPHVDRDFDARGFINANGVSTPEDLIRLVSKVADDATLAEAMASIPAITPAKRRMCERTMEQVANKIYKKTMNLTIKISEQDWNTAESYGRGSTPAPVATPVAPPGVAGASYPAKRTLVTGITAQYAESAVNLFASMRAVDKDCKKILYVWPDVNPKLYPVFQQHGVTEIRILPTQEPTVTPWPDYWNPQHFAWKLWIHNNLLSNAEPGECFLVLDAGIVIAGPVEHLWRKIEADGAFVVDDPTQQNERWCHPDSVANLKMKADELAGNQILGGILGYKAGGPFANIAQDALKATETRATIVGEKWHRYSEICFGHRHDQSILSVLTQRANLPRTPLNAVYCDISMRATKQFGVPFYVHRGNYREFEAFAKGIDETYLINLPRRSDRLEKFKGAHPELKDRTYVLPATDGRTLTLTKELAECFRDNDFKWKKSVMGCALSHLTLWEKLANDKVAKSYLIMEDDVHMNKDWLNKWNRIAIHMPADADVVYLGGVLPPNMPAFPEIIEPINASFARVKKNALFGGPPRRYFHFCNYAYLLTQAGARKIVRLVKERGIFTSGDHMIVNHGDELLNIYFTTPLLAKCWQDDDPAYQRSVFNDFSRVDTFDSDLWNNTECFTDAEVQLARGGQPVPSFSTEPKPKPVAPAPASEPEPEPEPEPKPEPKPKADETVKVWNAFLKAIALNDTPAIEAGIKAVFEIWGAMTRDEVVAGLCWFRVLEQLLVQRNAALQPFVPKILAGSTTQFPSSLRKLWDKVYSLYTSVPVPAGPGIEFITDLPANSIVAWHMEEITPTFHECQWLDNIFPKPLEYKKFNSLQTLLEAPGTPLVLYQKISGMDVSALFKIFATQFVAKGKQMIVLHLSDEFANDPIDFYDSPAVKAVIRNYWRPSLPSKAILIPLGYASGRSAKHLPAPPSFAERKNIFAFSGSLDRPGRAEALNTLKTLTPHDIHTREAWNVSAPQTGPEYNASLRHAKFVPCFKGSCALESFRIYEALEHGAIPVYVPAESTAGTADELKEQFGAHPLLGFPSWEVASKMLPLLAQKSEVMEKHRVQIMAWWAERKAQASQQVSRLF